MHDATTDLTRAAETDTQFFRALLLGAGIGAPALWGVLTAIFAATTSAGWVNAAAYSALPGLFCGPFLGGLVTTTIAMSRQEAADHDAGTAVHEVQRAA